MARYRFGEFDLDAGALTLKREGELLALRPKVLSVLCYLVERRGKMVSKAELLQALWADEPVGESVLTWSVSHIRRALGQKRSDKSPIETIYGRGYRFTAEVHEVPAPQSESPGLPGRATQVVGRERVMHELQGCVADAREGHGGLIVVSGEAGIGKTHCVTALGNYALAQGLQKASGRCPPGPGTPSLWPIAAALDRLPGMPAGGSGLESLNASGHNDPRADPGASFRAIEECAGLLRQLGGRRALLLTLDDLHWADLGTLRLLDFIAPELSELPLCIVATMRVGERESDPARRRLLLRLLESGRSIPLEALASEEVAHFVQVLTGQQPSRQLAQAIRRASGGVPLFLKALAHSLLWKHGELALSELSPAQVQVPALARDLLRQRLDRLPATTLSALGHAAVIGESFELSLLASTLEREPDALLQQLEPALAEGYIESEAPHAYRFCHSLYQSVLYDDLPAAQRVFAHRKVGVKLAASPYHRPHNGVVARHYYLSLPAGEHDTVLRHALRAGDVANASLAFEDAAIYFGWALEALSFAEHGEPRQRGELLLALASAQRSAGRTDDASDSAARLIELAQQHGMHDLVVKATRLRRPSIAMASMPDRLARSALELLHKQLPEAPEPVYVSLLAQLACLPPYQHDLSPSKQLSERALALAERSNDREGLFEALRARLFVLSGPDDVEHLLEAADRILALDREGPHTWLSADALRARYSAYLLTGRIADADGVLDQMTAAVQSPLWGEAMFYCERLRAQRLLLDGCFEQAQLAWKAAYQRAVRVGVAYSDVFDQAFALNLSVEQAGPGAIADRLRSITAAPHRVGRRLRLTLARVAAQAGALDFVARQLPALGAPADYRRDLGYLNALSSLSVCSAALEDHARCRQLLDELCPYAHLNTPDALGYYLGSVSHFLGLLHAALGDLEAAASSFESALRHNDALGYRAGAVRSLERLAEIEMRAGRREAADAHRDEAARRAQAIGMAAATSD